MIGRARANVSLLLNLLPLLAAGCGTTWSVAALDAAPPEECSAAVRKELAAPGLRVLRDERPFIDFWLRAAIPTVEAKAESKVRYSMLKPGGLVGVARFHAAAVDFRAQKVLPGVYTLRYGVQPDDGDHQDKTEARDFLLLCPAAADGSPEPMEHKPLTKLSATLHGKKHPAVLFLAAPGDGPRPGLSRRGDPEEVVLEASGGKSMRLAIVVVGQYME
jgi:hypothetical protein